MMYFNNNHYSTYWFSLVWLIQMFHFHRFPHFFSHFELSHSWFYECPFKLHIAIIWHMICSFGKSQLCNIWAFLPFTSPFTRGVTPIATMWLWSKQWISEQGQFFMMYKPLNWFFSIYLMITASANKGCFSAVPWECNKQYCDNMKNYTHTRKHTHTPWQYKVSMF